VFFAGHSRGDSQECPALHREIKVLPVELPTASMLNGIITLENSTLSSVAKLSSSMSSRIAQRLARKK